VIRAILLYLLLATPALAHGPDDPDAAWFQSLKVPGDPMMPMTGSSCCNGGHGMDADCKNVEVRIRDGHWEAFIDSKTFPDVENYPLLGHAPNAWVRVPDGVIIRGRENPTGRSVACWFNQVIRCFVQGTDS